MEVKGRIRLSKNNATDANGLAIPPLLSDLDYGQVAVNYSKDDPCLFFKKNGEAGDEIVKIVTEEKIAQTLSEILGGAAADLDTLKELLDKFTGSDNDVLNLITTIQTEVAKKADKTTLSNHTGSTSNPHGVTKGQVGLGNVLDKEQLGKNEKAADSDKLDGLDSTDFARNANYGDGVDLNGVSISGTARLLTGVINSPKTPARTNGDNLISLYWDGNAQKQLYFDHASNDIFYRRKSGTWGGWQTLYHSGNSNNGNVNWTAKNLFVTATSGTRNILIGNQDSGGVNRPNIIQGVNGIMHFGYGDSWEGTGGNFTQTLTIRGDRVGIKNTVPSYPLDVVGDIKTSGTIYARNFKGLPFVEDTNGSLTQLIGTDGNGADKKGGDVSFISGRSTGNAIGGSFRFYTSNVSNTSSSSVNGWVDRMIIRYDGNVGIGSTNPTTKLDVVGNIRIGQEYAGSNGEPKNQELIFRGYYGDYAKIVMPEISASSAKGQLDFYIRRDTTGNSNAVPELAMTIDYLKNLIVKNNIKARDITLESGTINLEAGGLAGTQGVGANVYPVRAFEKNGWKFTVQNTTYGTFSITDVLGTTEYLTVKNGGNVGIGTNNPRVRLDVSGDAKIKRQLFIGDVYTGNQGYLDIDATGDSSNSLPVKMQGAYYGIGYNRNISLQDRGGNVGIGTLSPTAKLHVVGNTALAGNLGVGGTINSVGQISTEDEVIAAGDIKSTAGGIIAAGEVIAYKAATAAQEGTPSGSLGIVYDGLDSTEPDVALSANQGRILNENVTAVRSLATEAATTATWSNIAGCPSEFAPTAHNHYDATYVSDRRLKSNIETIENGLEHCLSMNPVQYDWTQEALDRFGFASTKAYGMIAQEMELLLPHVTKKIDDHTLSIDYIQTIPFLVSAIKQLHALIKEANINNNNKTRAANRAFASEKTNAQVIADLRAEIEELKNMVYAK